MKVIVFLLSLMLEEMVSATADTSSQVVIHDAGGADSNVTATEGDHSVLLPCVLNMSKVNVSMKYTVLWSLVNSLTTIIHTNLQGTVQDQRYENRTEMRPDALETGNLSLTLLNPKVDDSNNYKCTLRATGEKLSETHVQLVVSAVSPPAQSSVGIVVGVFAFIGLVAAGGLAVYFYRKKNRKKNKNQDVPRDEETELLSRGNRCTKCESGAISVRLSWDTPPDLSQSSGVEWTKGSEKVHVYMDGSDQPERQHRDYKGRTEMDVEDTSLTLKHPRLKDAGNYTCTVYGIDKNDEKKMTLLITEPVVEVDLGAVSVKLPFNTSPDLPANCQVRWWFVETNRCVIDSNDPNSTQHVDYRDRTEMPEDALISGDLSVTLRHPTQQDEGTYECRVFDDMHLLREKTLKLTVRENPEDQG